MKAFIQDSRCRLGVREGDSLFSLERWEGSATLDFGKGEDWAGTVVEGKNEIIVKPYADPKKQHLIRRLAGERFEYDVILLREPDTNRISIDLSFPEGLEFFRQPSLDLLRKKKIRCEPEVIDSYAVYWKERNGRFKTGKFCHIYRPLIRDARGRSVWGGLDIRENAMTVTIPEPWLAEASYPVVVDPVIGTQTRGALKSIDWYGEDDPTDFLLDCSMGLNRFTASEAIQGQCTSYIYSYVSDSMNGQAVCFSNTGSVPSARLSRNEQIVSLDRTAAAWVPSTFTLSRTIAAGETFWYGYNARYGVMTYYDVGGTFRRMDTQSYSAVPEAYADSGDVWQIIMSMYFDYSLAQNYARVLGAGMGAIDANVRRLGAARSATDGAGAASGMSRFAGMARSCRDALEAWAVKRCLQDLTRGCVSGATAFAELFGVQSLFRLCRSALTGFELATRSRGVSRLLSSAGGILESIVGRMILKKEELVIVSRITRECTFRGNLV